MKIVYYCPCIVKCIAQKYNIKILTLTIKQKLELAPTQIDVKKIDKKIKTFLTKDKNKLV
jgi:hypothetical protein